MANRDVKVLRWITLLFVTANLLVVLWALRSPRFAPDTGPNARNAKMTPTQGTVTNQGSGEADPGSAQRR